MPVITLANTKGGSGKTTTALVLAGEYVRLGYKVAVIDCDAQRWITSWAETCEAAAEIDIISQVAPEHVGECVAALKQENDFVIVDLPSNLDSILAAAVLASDHVLVPFQGSPADLRGAEDVLEFIHLLKEQCDFEIAHSALLTRNSAAFKSRSVMSALKKLESRGTHILKTSLNDRSAFREMFEEGVMLHNAEGDTVSNLSKARENVRALGIELKWRLPRFERKTHQLEWPDFASDALKRAA